ncbi:lipoprotein [Erwinia piriflorinigrans]|uniref:Putative lipoprotein yajG n=1 Tax=Erwinia piriflorinigrans CFBP 5888 TaxID=1161919 RepID=V5Z548_9GAMM|nr:lipoprotein [Erwinia piriflorinigrans]CCG86413.1 putative lipoprotein yajG precursor [Erwinia piriflorinigrans CFBP 5888]
MLKKVIFPLLAIFILAGCANNSSTLDVAPKIQLPQRDPGLMAITVSITGADRRSDQALAKVNRDGQLVTLTPSRDLRFLLQETLEKQMTARGYMVGPSGAVDLQIVVNNLYADVTQGNVRYSITTKADISIIATAKNGSKQVKNYRQTNSVEGAFSATNDKITNVVNNALGDVIADMAQDTSVTEFIKQNAR